MENASENKTLGRILEDQAGRLGDKPFFYFEDKVFSYRETNEKANRLASGYQSLGVKKGDTVVAMLPNCPEFIFHWFGIAKLGAVDTPINTAYKGDLLRHVIEICKAKVMIVDEEFVDRIKFIEDELSILETKLKFEVIPFEELEKKEPDFIPPEELISSDPLMIIYTSGTTGPSKGAVLPHHALYYYAQDTIESLGFREDDIVYTNLPLYHINARFFTVMTRLINGGSFALLKKFSASNFWDEIRKYKATVFCLPGSALINFIYHQPKKDNDGDNPARIAMIGPVSAEMAQAFEKRYNLKSYLGYFGMTEANYITSLDYKEMEKLKAEGKWDQAMSMGREDPERYRVKLVDDNDNEVPVGKSGEITCHPARPYSMMLGYINMPEKSLEVFKNLWFHTGDMAKKDEEGIFYFVDRKKDYLRRRGENISSYEVEKVINFHPAVAESAVIGVKSEFGGDEVKSIVRLKEGKTLTYEELMAWCEERMAIFMVPRFVQYVTEDLPKTPTGRVQKYKLREIDQASDTWDREKSGYQLKK